uniref:Uncharacterized protein n=1 Tax=Bradyrhizobium ottawaense TaxID=931866 RepID=A0A2U8P3Y6_9BRAD|nr:hypothetical protein CIT37_09625 [Bradyrhizobium ottawaense]
MHGELSGEEMEEITHASSAPSLQAQRSNPESLRGEILDCFVARAPRNDAARVMLAMMQNGGRARPNSGSGTSGPPHSLRSYRYDFDTICQPSASFIATR